MGPYRRRTNDHFYVAYTRNDHICVICSRKGLCFVSQTGLSATRMSTYTVSTREVHIFNIPDASYFIVCTQLLALFLPPANEVWGKVIS